MRTIDQQINQIAPRESTTFWPCDDVNRGKEESTQRKTIVNLLIRARTFIVESVSQLVPHDSSDTAVIYHSGSEEYAPKYQMCHVVIGIV